MVQRVGMVVTPFSGPLPWFNQVRERRHPEPMGPAWWPVKLGCRPQGGAYALPFSRDFDLGTQAPGEKPGKTERQGEPHCWLLVQRRCPGYGMLWISDIPSTSLPYTSNQMVPPLWGRGLGGGEVDHSLLEWCTFPHRLWKGENRLKPEERLGFVLCSPLKLGWQTSGSSLLLLIIKFSSV